MVVETAKNKIVLNQIVGQKRETRQIETVMIVNDVKPDVLNVIATNGEVNIYKKEVMDGKIRIDGAINTYVIYIPDDEHSTVRSLNTSLDFTQIIDMENAKENMDLQANIKIKNFDTKIINGRKINIKANLDISLKIYSNESLDIITGVEKVKDAQILKSTQKITSLVGRGSHRVSVKDTVAIDVADELAEIMKVDFKIIDEETKISYNKILSKAEAVVEIMYLTEDNRINKVTTRIPIMGFVDIEDVNENCECEVQNSLSNLIVKPNNQGEHSILIDAEIEVICAAYETKEINIIEDLYSITEDIEFTQKYINVVTRRNKIKENYTLQENIRIPELTGQVFDIQANPVINNTQIRNGKIVYEGNLNLQILFEQNNGVNLRTVDLPFNFDLVSDKIEDKSNIETVLEIKENNCIVKDGIIEISVAIQFNVYEHKNRVLNLLEEISVEDCKDTNRYSMIIYFVKPGDTIWKIAKMFKSTVEDIVNINDIENENKINVGQQLYIPRFCKNRIMV